MDRSCDQARADIASFLLLRPTLVVAPPTEQALAGRAWPSPVPGRWPPLAGGGPGRRIDADVTAAVLVGCVGSGAGIELVTWLQDLDLPDPESALADPVSFVLPERGDQVYAALTAVAAAVAADATRPGAAGWEVLAGRRRQRPTWLLWPPASWSGADPTVPRPHPRPAGSCRC
ncbi:MAG: hypothetical protein R2761_31200 [Acidimicrobiales bacterium]